MIDAAQIRAARGLLRWNQGRLAREAGFDEKAGKNEISKIETGKTIAPRQDTLEKIQRAFEAFGIDFLPQSGVRIKDTIVETYELDAQVFCS